MSVISHRGSAAAGRALLALLLLAGAAAQAQPPSKPAPLADPLDANAAVPPLVHRSALSTYRPAGEVPLRSWKDANDTVTRIGGWRSYLREANAPEAPVKPEPGATPAAPTAPATVTPAASSAAPSPAASAPASSTTPPPPSPRGHGAHGKH